MLQDMAQMVASFCGRLLSAESICIDEVDAMLDAHRIDLRQLLADAALHFPKNVQDRLDALFSPVVSTQHAAIY
jgi:hypothetical protein